MNQMVANLYATNNGPSTPSKTNTTVEMETSTKAEEEQQTKRKQSTEKTPKKVKRKRPTESTSPNDIEGIMNSIVFSAKFNFYLPA